MGTKKEVKAEIIRKLEENFNYILNSKDSILNLERILSTKDLRISMYHIKIFMKDRGYIYDKTTNEWKAADITEENTIKNEGINEDGVALKITQQEINKDIESQIESITDDLKNFLKKNSQEKKEDNTIQKPSNFEEKSEENISENILKNIKEKSLIPEENIIKEIWKNTDNVSSNCELILKSITMLSEQLKENPLNVSKKEYKLNNPINDNNKVEILPNQLMDILDGENKRYEMTLSVAFFEAIKQKFFLRHPDKSSTVQAKDSKILYKILIDYFTS